MTDVENPAVLPCGDGAVLVTSVELGPHRGTWGGAVATAVERAVLQRGDTGRCAAAWVLLWQGGRPFATLDLPLPPDPADVAARLEEFPTDISRGEEAEPLPSLPTVTVVVPTVVQRVADLDRCLTGLEALHHPGGAAAVELLLVDNRPVVPAEDPLPELLARHPRVRRLHAPRPGISQARNAGTAAARGDVVAFTDDDVLVDPRWVLALATRFATHPEEDVVTGLVVPAELETAAQRGYEAHYGGFGGTRRLTPAQVVPVRGRPGRVRELGPDGDVRREFPVYGIGAFGAGANMAFRRPALRRGFDVHLGTGTPARGGEDLAVLVDLLWRGGRLGYEPAAVVHHTHRRDLAGLEHQLRGNGVGYTAMLTALVHRDPRHLGALAGLVPAAAVAKLRWARDRARSGPADARTSTSTSTSTSTDTVDPRRLVRLELRGMPWGPLAYWRARAAARPVPQENP
ncbi:glycosyltransferase [Kineococcus sp. DHX-1]|uniref:glycosyltransferase n=1 Tax=Kineococcus sp. DHX-1 TaxID=3349638 RepID=UPI0036D37C92